MVAAVLLSAMGVLLAGAARPQHAATPRPFLTEARTWTDHAVSGSPPVASAREIAFAWSDRDTAVHLPFLVQGDGPRRVSVRLETGTPVDLSSSTFGLAWLAGNAWDPGIEINGGPLVRTVASGGMTVGIAATPVDATEAGSSRVPRLGLDLGEPGDTTFVVDFPGTAPRGPWSIWFNVPAATVWPGITLEPAATSPAADSVTLTFTAMIAVDSDADASAVGEPMTVTLESRRNGWRLGPAGVTTLFAAGARGVRTSGRAEDGVLASSLELSENGERLAIDYRVEVPQEIRDGDTFDVSIAGSAEASSSGLPVAWAVDLNDGRAPAMVFDDVDLAGTAHELREIHTADLPAAETTGRREGAATYYAPPPPAAAPELPAATLFGIEMRGVARAAQAYERLSAIESNASPASMREALVATLDPAVVDTRPVLPAPLPFQGPPAQPAASGPVTMAPPRGATATTPARSAGALPPTSPRTGGGMALPDRAPSRVWFWLLAGGLFAGCAGLVVAILRTRRARGVPAAVPARRDETSHRLHLLVQYPDGGRKEGTLHLRGRVTVGRSEDAGLQLNDNSVSSRHAQLSWHEGRLVVTDLGSANGTRVGGERVRKARVEAGDTLTFGATRVVVTRIE